MEEENGLSRLPDWQPLRDRAYDAIKAAILSLSLKPGEPLIERNLAARLGISKTPIRGALVRLEREGLVTMTPFKGAVVAGIYKEDIREIFELREAIEGLAARKATAAITEEDLQEGERLLKMAEEALEQGRYHECSKFGSDIHNIIIERAGNERLASILCNLDDHYQRFRLVSAQIPGRLARSAEEHRGILEAMKAQDADLAEARMRAHLRGALDELMRQENIESLPERGQS